ncbi:hypothetical protein PMAYCL1PPCAC_12422, partial [Pristionchus mayeri]
FSRYLKYRISADINYFYSTERMFETTIVAAELFSNTLKCSNCQKVNDSLQMCGESCKHPFCWDCINLFMQSDTFVLCPLCKLPLDMRRPSNCYLFNNLSALLSDLRAALTKYSHMAAIGSAETQHLLTALQKPVERGIDDFCSQQVCADLPTTSASRDNFEAVPEYDSLIERSMGKDDNFFIETAGLVNIGKPVDHSTQKDVPDLFASQAVPEWNPSKEISRTLPLTSKVKSVPKEWIDESLERRSGGSLKRSATDVLTRRSSGRLSNEKAKEKKETPKSLNSSFLFDEEDDMILDISMRKHEMKRDKRESSAGRNTAERKKSDVHPKKKSLGGKKGERVLINAVILGNEKKLKEALESGCDPNERDPDGLTAVYMAAERNMADICIALIESGAVVNAYCGDLCRTALHAAALFDAKETAKVLISKGGSRRAKDLKGATPEMLAATEEIKLLITRHSSVPLQIVFPPRKSLLLFLHDGIDPKVRRMAGSNYDVVNSMGEANTLVVEGEMGRTTLSVQILEGIARGLTIVTEDWLSVGGDERDLEVKSIKNGDECEYEGGCIASRKNAQKMMPPLFYGTSFYFCHSKYGGISKNEYIEIIKAGGGKILTREPVPTLEELSPFHARQLSSYFVLFNPRIQVSQKLLSNERLNLVSYNWLQESLARFELIQPY